MQTKLDEKSAIDAKNRYENKMGFTGVRDITPSDTDSESDMTILTSVKEDDEDSDDILKHQSKRSHKAATLTYLMGLDFKKHIDVLNLVNMPNFELTEDEQDANCTNHQLLKVIKIILYQMGITEEKQRWQNDDFLRDYDKKEKEKQEKYEKELQKVRDLHVQYQFDNETL